MKSPNKVQIDIAEILTRCDKNQEIQFEALKKRIYHEDRQIVKALRNMTLDGHLNIQNGFVSFVGDASYYGLGSDQSSMRS